MTAPRGLIIAARHQRYQWRKRAERILIIVVCLAVAAVAVAMWSR